jgi:hypoxanthine-guanine phosphoribosyltransferase
MIPSKEESDHFNFPDIVTYLTTQDLLRRLQEALKATNESANIVINFEKSHWFEIFPLAQLLTLLLSNRINKPKLHIVGPSINILPYFYSYIAKERDKLHSGNLSNAEMAAVESKIKRHAEILPQLRARAGAFLVGWGALDIIQENYPHSYWYASRETTNISLGELRDTYLFGYGGSTPIPAHEAERVWPFNSVFRTDQEAMLERINSEELIAGALRKYGRANIVADGSMQNILFFEPFENVFQHAFRTHQETDFALVVMRVTDWMFTGDQVLTNKAQWLLTNLTEWERAYILSLTRTGGSFMEIIIADYGQGIPGTLANQMMEDSEYCKQRNLTDSALLDALQLDWEAIRYSFEPHSTQKTVAPPGKRGLAWIKEKIGQIGGLIQVVSNGANYVVAEFGNGQVELKFQDTKLPVKSTTGGTPLHGTYVRIVLPLNTRIARTLERRPRWERHHPDRTLFTESPSISLHHFPIEQNLMDSPEVEDWDKVFEEAIRLSGEDRYHLSVLDFKHQSATRWSLENFFQSFLKHQAIHGRVLVVNCSRHVVCRLDTITHLEHLQQNLLFIPFFESNLRLYLAGTTPKVEATLLHWFQHGSSDNASRIDDIAIRNPGYFIFENGKPFELSFGIEEVEQNVRESLGYVLEDSLARRGAVHNGRYILPLSGKTVSRYVEPHQLFTDTRIASLLCGHLAVLLRWRFGRITQGKNMRVLTATRIGRDIAIRMPEAYPHKKTFIYFDYHLVQPDKPRLRKHIAGGSVVIVVDIITTGSQVEELIRVCEDANCEVLGIISFIDFSPGKPSHSRIFQRGNGSLIEHKTFLRSPQQISDPEHGDIPVDKLTLSLSPPPEVEREITREGVAVLSRDRGLRLLEDAEVIHHGHYDLFGHHFDFVTNFNRLFTTPSMQRDEIIRFCEGAILRGLQNGTPTAIVLYPDLSNAHILQGVLERQHKIQKLIADNKLQFVEARRGPRARGRRYWLTRKEIDKLREWAKSVFQDNYSILILDEVASSGETLLALLDLARELEPKEVAGVVLVNEMPHLRMYHHQEIERFVWAKSNFICLLHLNLPVYLRETCPMCQERGMLMRELRQAKKDWFREEIERRLGQLDLITTLHPQDLPEGELAMRIEGIPPFSWEDRRIFPGSRQSAISRAMSACIAINDGIPIQTVLEEITQQPNDNIWHLTAITIGRRVDLQQTQHAEKSIRESFIKIIGGRNIKRKRSSIEALRYMTPESLIQTIELIVRAALTGPVNDEIIAELILLMRRVFFYRHLSIPLAFDKELQVVNELDAAAARSQEGSPFRTAVERINFEWGTGLEPRLDLVTVIRQLESVLMTHHRPEHRLLYELSEYISDERQDADYKVKASLDNAVRAASLTKIFARLLQQNGQLQDEDLHKKAQLAYEEARELRRWVESHMRKNEKKAFRVLRTKLEAVTDLCADIEAELNSQLVDPIPLLREYCDSFQKEPTKSFESKKVSIKLDTDISDSTLIIIDRALFQSIIKNLFHNLRHAVDEQNNTVEAIFSVSSSLDNLKPQVHVSVFCGTRGKLFDAQSEGQSTTAKLRRSAEMYGVEHQVAEESKSSSAPWRETWSFWRL